MKYLKSFIFFIGLVTMTGCHLLQKDTSKNLHHNISSVELTERTRGTDRSFTMVYGKLENSTNGKITSQELSENEWFKILKKAETINLDKISKLVSPSTKRYSDAALASTLIISKNGTEYQSSDFDSGNPPAELEDIYNEIKRIIETKKSK